MRENQFSAEMGIPKVPEWIPGLPEELGLECLTRLPYSAHPTASRVCRPWRSLLESEEFYRHRKQSGYTRNVACLVQAVAAAVELSAGPKPGAGGSPSYGIAVFDSVSGTWERLDPIPKYPNGLPMFCRVASCEGKLVVMGGWDPATYKPVTDVFVYEFTTCRWRRGAPMPSKRSFFAIGSRGSRVYIAGGHDESKNALKSAWVYDLRRDEWAELTQMSRERDECHGVVIGDEFWVVSGYGTDSQGGFVGSAEVYEIGSGRWRRVEDAWRAGECPRSCVGIGKDGKLFSWGERDSAVRAGPCGVELGRWAFVSGSEYLGGPHEFFLTGGENGKLEKVETCEGFSGFVQSGCFVEI